jgi:hypothetical protein
MPFHRQKVIAPEKIGDIMLELFSPDPEGQGVPFAHVSIYVRMDDGEVKVRREDLVEHFGQEKVDELLAFAESIRAKAIEEVLPVKGVGLEDANVETKQKVRAS